MPAGNSAPLAPQHKTASGQPESILGSASASESTNAAVAPSSTQARQQDLSVAAYDAGTSVPPPSRFQTLGPGASDVWKALGLQAQPSDIVKYAQQEAALTERAITALGHEIFKLKDEVRGNDSHSHTAICPCHVLCYFFK